MLAVSEARLSLPSPSTHRAVTNAQYAELMNAVTATDAIGLYNADMESGPLGGISRSGSSAGAYFNPSFPSDFAVGTSEVGERSLRITRGVLGISCR